MVNKSSVVAVANAQVSSDLAGEAVILNLNSGQYFSLDTVGARIWNLLQKPTHVSEIHDCILSEYEVEPLQCEHDLLQLLKQLETQGLIEVSNVTAA